MKRQIKGKRGSYKEAKSIQRKHILKVLEQKYIELIENDMPGTASFVRIEIQEWEKQN
jgi:hypothetical protein